MSARMVPHDAADILAALTPLGATLRGLSADSRHITTGDGFAAYPGEAGDGRDYIDKAIAAGASAVLWEQQDFSWPARWADMPNLGVANLKARVGEIAAQLYGQPAQALWMIGVTGTNGKTSCAHWLARCLNQLDRRAAVIGTLGNGFPDQLGAAHNTTPDAIVLQRSLADYVRQGAQAAVMEVSSHGLAQGRVNGAKFDVAVLTNLSRDHLDYHGDMDRYGAAKASLFAWPGLKHAVLNLDDAFGRTLSTRLENGPVNVVGYGLDAGRVRGEKLQLSASGLSMRIASDWGNAQLTSPLLGRFNASNLLATLATLLVSGVSLNDAVQQLATLQPVAGRMQALGGGEKPVVVVDYAHTPDALEKVLSTLKQVNPNGRLICVFGCGGNRDAGKRPLMGGIAAQLADEVVVTSDNPRNEDPLAIIRDISADMGANHHIEPDRAQAILGAVQSAQRGDVVLVAGKGHKDYQEIHGVKYPFSDVEIAQRALEGWA